MTDSLSLTGRMEDVREALRTVDRLRSSAERRQRETEAILEGLTAILQPGGSGEVWGRMFRVFHRLVEFDHAFVLESSAAGDFACTAATDPAFLHTRWQPGRLFERVLDGHVTATYSVRRVPEWQNLTTSLLASVGSALYAPLHHEDGQALIVLVSERQGAFSREHLANVTRFSTFASQTMVNVRSTRLREINVELERARDAAERAREAQFRFLATMSHELRTPMTGILGMLTLLDGTNLDAVQRSFLEPLQHSADALLALLNDILDTSKIEAGELSVEATPFDLRACSARHMPLLRETVVARGLAFELEWDGPDDEVFVLGDPMRLQQVITNFVNNAAKFTEEGGVTLGMHVELVDDMVHLTCEVRDTGPGIPPEQQHRIFLPFTQRDNSISRRYGGTGLGLSICRQLIEAMDGTIGVRSTEGEGSTFWFDLTLPATAPVAGRDVQAAEGVERPSRRLLVADDNPTNQFLLDSWLTKIGHTVTVVANGQEALEALGRGSFDAVLLDMHMPVMDGATATRAIRQMPGIMDIPIYALTADAISHQRDEHMKAGLDGYLTKPIDFDALDRLIAALPSRT